MIRFLFIFAVCVLSQEGTPNAAINELQAKMNTQFADFSKNIDDLRKSIPSTPDLSHFVTKADLANIQSLIEDISIPDVSGLAKMDDLHSHVSQTVDEITSLIDDRLVEITKETDDSEQIFAIENALSALEQSNAEENTKLHKSVNDLRRTVQDLQRVYEETVPSLETSVQSLEAQVVDYKKTQEASVNTLNTIISNMQATQESANSEIAKTLEKIGQVQQEQKKQFENMEYELGNLAKTLKSEHERNMEGAIEQLKAELRSEMTTDITSLWLSVQVQLDNLFELIKESYVYVVYDVMAKLGVHKENVDYFFNAVGSGVATVVSNLEFAWNTALALLDDVTVWFAKNLPVWQEAVSTNYNSAMVVLGDATSQFTTFVSENGAAAAENAQVYGGMAYTEVAKRSEALVELAKDISVEDMKQKAASMGGDAQEAFENFKKVPEVSSVLQILRTQLSAVMPDLSESEVVFYLDVGIMAAFAIFILVTLMFMRRCCCSRSAPAESAPTVNKRDPAQSKVTETKTPVKNSPRKGGKKQKKKGKR